MTAGETLLKVTDIPFSYSLLAIIMGVMGVKFEGVNIVLLIGTAGVLGTFLTATDPVGRLLKSNLKQGISQLRKKSENPDDVKWDFAKNAIKTRAIGLEIDKFVSMFYLALILVIFSSSVTYFPEFSENLQLYGEDKKTICDSSCAGIVGVIFAGIAAAFLALVAMKSWKELKYYSITAGIHHRGISSEFVTSTTIENMSRAIEQNDWQTASEWSKIIETEIRTKKGKKEQIIEAVQQIFRPLYVENMSIESAMSSMIKSGNSVQIPIAEWNSIQTDPRFLMIDDESLRQSLKKHYSEILEYNQLQTSLGNITNDIVKNRVKEYFGNEFENIYYWIKTDTGEGAPSISPLLLTGTHPLRTHPEELNAVPISLEPYGPDGSKRTKLTSKKDFENFENMWERMILDTNENPKIKKIRELFISIKQNNQTLKEDLLEKIKQSMYI